MPTSNRPAWLRPLILAVVAGGMLHAGTLQWTGNTLGIQPLWNRPTNDTDPGTFLALIGGGQGFIAQQFTVDTSGSYSFSVTPTGAGIGRWGAGGQNDILGFLYHDSFDPTQPLVHTGENGSCGAGCANPFWSTNLTAGTVYWIVVTGYCGTGVNALLGCGPQQEGPFSATLTGPGTISNLGQTGTSNIFQVRYLSNLNVGDSYINLTNTGANGADLLYGTGANVSGAICVNVYAFSPDEQLVACCSCPVTPNALSSLSVQNDLLNNIVSLQAIPTSLSIALTATEPVGGSCNGSAWAAPTFIGGTVSLAPGLLAWGTSLHALTSVTPTAYVTTGTAFVTSVLSSGEATRLQQLCVIDNANNSGYGVCNSCRSGGLAATKK